MKFVPDSDDKNYIIPKNLKKIVGDTYFLRNHPVLGKDFEYMFDGDKEIYDTIDSRMSDSVFGDASE